VCLVGGGQGRGGGREEVCWSLGLVEGGVVLGGWGCGAGGGVVGEVWGPWRWGGGEGRGSADKKPPEHLPIVLQVSLFVWGCLGSLREKMVL
jgi:hypothetical protein